MVSSRRCGVAARGSSWRASSRSSVVIEMATLARFFAAIGARMSMSRCTSVDLLTMPTGWLNSLQHLEHAAGDAMLALDRLIGVGVGAERDDAAR